MHFGEIEGIWERVRERLKIGACAVTDGLEAPDVADDRNCCCIVFLTDAQLYLLKGTQGEAQIVRNKGEECKTGCL